MLISEAVQGFYRRCKAEGVSANTIKTYSYHFYRFVHHLFADKKEKIENVSTLVVCKLDRFARTVTEGIEKVRFLFGKGVKVHVLNVGLLEDTPMGKFFITTLLAVAELERCMIMERTLAGKEIAKTRKGYREGRPPVLRDKIEYAMRMIDEQHYSYRETAKLTGISVSTIVRYRKRIAIA